MTLPDPALFLGFMVAAVALNLTPGPDMAYVATRTLAEGRPAGIASAFGVSAGGLVHTLLAALGLGSLFHYAPLAFDIVKLVGAAYLVWIAIRLWRSTDDPSVTAEAWAIGSRRAFYEGALTNILNPKVAIFFLALLPQFVDPARGSVAGQMIWLGIAFNVSGTIVNVAVAMLTARAGSAVRASPAAARLMRRLAAVVFVGFAARLALAERP